MPGLWPWTVRQEFFRRSDDLSERHGAEAVEQSQAGVERGRDGCGLDSPGGDSRGALEMLESCQTRSSALTVDHGHDLVLGVIKEDGNFAAETERSRVGDAQGKDRGGACVGCISARLEDAEPGGDGIAATGCDGPLCSFAFPICVGGRRCALGLGFRAAPRLPGR